MADETAVAKTGEHTDDGRVIDKRWFSRANFLDVEFPLLACRPAIIDATTRAMALKVFDEIGILPPDSSHTDMAAARKGDPVIVGRIVDPRAKPGWAQRKRLSFLIGWFVDTKDL